ncbi:CARDB domain-containing protein [Brevibacillus laterosporus]|uniref:CARDB domain-containing protein n=1 Tax=Brevibacillus laterosporus TaxID=1465 RepID=UPI0003B1EC95|nr:CARDB domain-containing protein [Brevibacillus laterosporus]ERM16727.1 hypothetical protein P615_22260 [Brevibacillus laterosporus PE36]
MPNTPVTLNTINNNLLSVKAELDTLFALLKPDLVPVPSGPGPSFCHRIGNRLIVTVRNQGMTPAPETITRVDFDIFGRVDVLTPPLPPFNQVDLSINFPTGVFDPDADFTITVDFFNDVDEKDETNNIAFGICPG